MSPFRHRVRVWSAVLAAGFVALWFASFASACMAATDPARETSRNDCTNIEVSVVAPDCEQALKRCELPQLNATVSVKSDFSFAPAVAGPATLSIAAPEVADDPPTDWRARRPAHTPLYLTYLALLN